MRSPSNAVATIADQVASSASNTLIVLALAQIATVEVFGRVAIYFAVITFSLALVRGAFGTVLLLSGPRPLKSTKLECSLASTAALIVFIPIAAVMVAMGTATRDLETCVTLAIAGPPLLLQDVQRHAALARGRALTALLWDGVWVAGTIVLLVLTWRDLIFRTPGQLIGCWAALAMISYLGLASSSGAWPRVRLLRGWIRKHLALRVHYAAEASLGALTTAVLFAASAYFAGEQAAAALRGASTLFGPLSVIMSALPLLLLPAMAHDRGGLPAAWRAVRSPTLALTGAALLAMALVLVLPDQAGRFLLGDAWSVTRPIVAFTGVEYAAIAWLTAAFTCWRSARMGLVVFRARLSYSIVALVLAITAAAVFQQAAMIAFALALSALLVTTVAVIVLNRQTRMSRHAAMTVKTSAEGEAVRL
jgi:hypothetical protein